jgi:hypothetical protein
MKVSSQCHISAALSQGKASSVAIEWEAGHSGDIEIPRWESNPRSSSLVVSHLETQSLFLNFNFTDKDRTAKTVCVKGKQVIVPFKMFPGTFNVNSGV